MKLLLWFTMLSKRLYKKPIFLVILLLIPLVVLCYNAVAKEDSGMITVALSGPASASTVADDSQLIRYVPCDDARQAQTLVETGKADMAWVFPEDLAQQLEAFLQQPSVKNAVVTVLVRQDNVTLRLAREKLSGALYAQLSRLLYLRYVRENVPALSQLSDEALLEYYHTRDITDDLFTFDQDDPSMVSVQTVNYLTAPVRGLLGVLILLCSLATAMYYISDSRRGLFSWVSGRSLWLVELGYQLTSLLNISAVALIALALARQSLSCLRELAVSGLYCLCCAAFAMLLRRVCKTVRTLGTLLPLLMVAMLLVCPVFFDFAFFRSLQYLFPPTYYVNAIYSSQWLLYLLLYTGIAFSLYALFGRLYCNQRKNSLY